MKHIRKFNEGMFNDALYAIDDSFNKVKNELELLDKRLAGSAGSEKELDKFSSEVSQMKSNFDKLLADYQRYFDSKTIE